MTSDVVAVATLGNGSMDVCGQELVRRLPVRRLLTEVGRRSAEAFGLPVASRVAARALAADAAFVRRARALDAPVHLTNHHLARYGPLLGRPYVVTVHDLIRQLDLRQGAGLISRPNARDRAVLRADAAGIRRARAIIAPSHATKRDLVAHLGVAPERIAVVPHGIDHDRFRPTDHRAVDGRYVLFVGSEHPRKNLVTLLRAFAALRREPRFADVRLVKVGAAGRSEVPFAVPTRTAIAELGLQEHVVLAGRVPDDELASYPAGATCLVLPSLLEGFGLPPLEAMACGCPAIVSSAGSLPEVVGDAGLVIAPRDHDALRDAMRTLLDDGAGRAELVARGLRRAAQFTWERAACETLRVYASAL